MAHFLYGGGELSVSPIVAFFLTLLLAASLWLLIRPKVSSATLPLPPGPPRLPLIGNLHQAPKSEPWIQFHRWSQEHGPVVYLNMVGQSIVVLNTANAVHDVFARQGAICSDRPHFVVASDLAHKGMHMLLRPYNTRFKLHQRLHTPLLSERAVKTFVPLEDLESKQLLWDLLQDSTDEGIDCQKQMERTTASVIFTLLYGQRLHSSDDWLLTSAHYTTQVFAQMVQNGAYLVDTFPVLNHLPRFLAPWKAEAERYWQQHSNVHLKNLNSGRDAAGWNLTKQMCKAVKSQGVDITETELALSLGSIANAALAGTSETMMWFLVACVAHDTDQYWIHKAQEQLDAVVGRDRMPTFEDQPKLPYIDAIFKETMRWRTAGPTGVPHYTKVGLTYQSLHIPKESILIANFHTLALEKGVYGLKYDVEKFIPERFLESGALDPDPPIFGFGHGRRVCPGRHFARNNLWIFIARILWAFDVKPGATPVSSMDGTIALVRAPLPFKVSFKPRGPWATDLITKDGDPRNFDHKLLLEEVGRAQDWK